MWLHEEIKAFSNAGSHWQLDYFAAGSLSN
jgi:hypothetical protein